MVLSGAEAQFDTPAEFGSVANCWADASVVVAQLVGGVCVVTFPELSCVCWLGTLGPLGGGGITEGLLLCKLTGWDPEVLVADEGLVLLTDDLGREVVPGLKWTAFLDKAARNKEAAVEGVAIRPPAAKAAACIIEFFGIPTAGFPGADDFFVARDLVDEAEGAFCDVTVTWLAAGWGWFTVWGAETGADSGGTDGVAAVPDGMLDWVAPVSFRHVHD